MPRHPYDEDKLVTLLFEGNKTYDDIAKEVGITASMVGKIARGESRHDLSGRVQNLQEERRRAIRHLAVRWGSDLMKAHIREGIEGSGETARKCREYVLGQLRTDRPLSDVEEAMMGPGARGGADITGLERMLRESMPSADSRPAPASDDEPACDE